MAKWSASDRASFWAAQNRAMDASSHVNSRVWVRVMTEKPSAYWPNSVGVRMRVKTRIEAKPTMACTMLAGR